MRIRPPHTAPGSCMRRYGAMIFSGLSKGTHTAHNEIFKLTYIQFMLCIYAPCSVGSVRVNTDRGVNTDGELNIPIKRNSEHVETNRLIP